MEAARPVRKATAATGAMIRAVVCAAVRAAAAQEGAPQVFPEMVGTAQLPRLNQVQRAEEILPGAAAAREETQVQAQGPQALMAAVAAVVARWAQTEQQAAMEETEKIGTPFTEQAAAAEAAVAGMSAITRSEEMGDSTVAVVPAALMRQEILFPQQEQTVAAVLQES